MHQTARLGTRIAVPGTPLSMRYEEAVELNPRIWPELEGVLRAAFNGGPSWFSLPVPPTEHLRWKTSPPDGALLELTEDGERLAGMLVIQRGRAWLQGRTIETITSTDAAMLPEYQGSGLTSARRRLRRDQHLVREMTGAALVLGFAGHPTSEVRRGVARESRPVGNDLVAYGRLLSLRALTQRSRPDRNQAAGGGRTRRAIESKRYLERLRSLLERGALGVRLIQGVVQARRREHLEDQLQVGELVAPDDRIDVFWERAREAFDLIPNRDSAHLTWRYADPRSGRFTLRGVWESGELVGYAALRLDGPTAAIADVLALPGRLDVVMALLLDACEQARGAGCTLIRGWLPRYHPYRAVLRQLGFVPYRSVVTLSYQVLDPEESFSLLDEPRTRIHVTLGDSDHI